MSACRKWIPTYTRASMISLIASEKRAKVLVGCVALLSSLNAILSVPKKSCSVWTKELLRRSQAKCGHTFPPWVGEDGRAGPPALHDGFVISATRGSCC
jgi:hypothetical protein